MTKTQLVFVTNEKYFRQNIKYIKKVELRAQVRLIKSPIYTLKNAVSHSDPSAAL